MTKNAPSASLRALLAGSIDYAGLFPPANLTLEPTLRNYAAYARCDESWMLARCVVPTHRLGPAGEFVVPLGFDAAHPLAISALGGKSDSAAEAFEILRAGLAAIAGFRAAHGERVTVEQLEMPLPPDLAPAALRALLREAAELIESLGPPTLAPFWEIPADTDWSSALVAFAEHNTASAGERCQPMSAKLRTGGVAATAFPASAQVAAALLAARDAGVAIKFTAGLHHPLRHFNAGVGALMHGFLNVYVAGVLTHEHRIDAAATKSILDDEWRTDFRFDDTGLAWRDLHVSTDRISALRTASITTFGSCSFDEPRDDLRSLALL